ncbi:hypothetical protein E5N71_09805 [Candidatus Nitrosocosmicus sp. SS]|nr:hypothetical protein [Candidatus Nitrosocosmicus sp. SS]KAF0868663.1 hypothetical protein E5N71_09805 [Candidatus Nitrosocosmicus sp. SS]
MMVDIKEIGRPCSEYYHYLYLSTTTYAKNLIRYSLLGDGAYDSNTNFQHLQEKGRDQTGNKGKKEFSRYT